MYQLRGEPTPRTNPPRHRPRYTSLVGWYWRIKKPVSDILCAPENARLTSQTQVLLNLHRPYFAQAVHDSPNETHKHRYLPSVVAIYRASWRIVHGLQLAWTVVPQILARLHLPWSQALSAAVCGTFRSLTYSSPYKPLHLNHRLFYAFWSPNCPPAI
jgi:hypothetical protein